jgi:hypothetical protein
MEAEVFSQSPRKVTLGSITKQSSNGRITFPLTMTLDGDTMGALPDWVSAGYDSVSENARSWVPEIREVADVLVAFSNSKPSSKLFADPDAKISNATLTGFQILRAGDPDEPEIELHFKIYAPFARDFWKWAGEMCGEEVYIGFPKTLAKAATKAPGEKSGTLPLKPAAGEQGGGPASPDQGKKSTGGPKKLN